MIDIALDEGSYTVLENIENEGLGLLVCATVIGPRFNFNVTLLPQDGSAVGTLEYSVRIDT